MVVYGSIDHPNGGVVIGIVVAVVDLFDIEFMRVEIEGGDIVFTYKFKSAIATVLGVALESER